MDEFVDERLIKKDKGFFGTLGKITTENICGSKEAIQRNHKK